MSQIPPTLPQRKAMFPQEAKKSLADIIASINEEERKQLFEDAERQARSDSQIKSFLDPTYSVPPPPPPDPSILTAGEQAQFQSALYEIASRKNEALKLFKPTPDQEAFFKSNSPERLILGSNRCLGAETKIFDPVLNEEKEVGSIVSCFHVYSLDHSSGEVVIAEATKPFIKGYDDLYEVQLSNGESFTCTLAHQVWTTDGYRSIGELRGLLAHDTHDALCLKERREDSRDDCQTYYRSHDEQPLYEEVSFLASSQPPGDVLAHNPGYSHHDDRDLKLGYNPIYQFCGLLSSENDQSLSLSDIPLLPSFQRHIEEEHYKLRSYFFRSVSQSDCREVDRLRTFLSFLRLANLFVSNPQLERHSFLVRDILPNEPLQTFWQSRVSLSFLPYKVSQLPPSQVSLDHPLLDGAASVPRESLGLCRLRSHSHEVSPQPGQELVFLPSIVSRPHCNQTISCDQLTWITSIKFLRRDFFYDLSVGIYHNYFSGSVAHHNSGKTTAAVLEVARACCGCDPYGKFPARDGRVVLAGPSLKHLGTVYFKKLFRPAGFYIIRDLETNQWRPFFPNDPADAARAHEARPAPPLIPPRFYRKKDVSWKLAGDEQPLSVRISKTGWVIDFHSFNAEPPRGIDIDFCLFDEESASPVWYSEMAARLLDRRRVDPKTGVVQSGKFVWSLTPQRATPIAFDLWKRAEAYKENQDPNDSSPLPVEAFQLGLMGNPHVSEAAKAEFREKFRDNPEELEVRMEGHWSIYGSLVYGDFMPKGVHGCQSFAIPDDWTRYVIVDPGVQVCAALFFAVPPHRSAYGGRKVVYDELRIKRCNAKIFAQKFMEKIGQTPIQSGIIDFHAGRMPELGSGKTVETQFSEALKEVGFKFATGGTNFQWSTDDIKARVQRVKTSLHIVDGRSELLVFWDRVPQLIKEIEHYANRKLPDGTVTDDPVQKNCDLCDCLGYGVTAELPYVRPVKKKREDWTERVLKERKAKAKKQKQLETGFGESFNVG